MAVALLLVAAPSWSQSEQRSPQPESSQPEEEDRSRERAGGEGVPAQPVAPAPVTPSSVEAEPTPEEKAAKAAAEKAERDDKRSDADLSAQEIMASAAVWMAIFTAAQVVIGGFGLGALFRTLRLTRESLDHAISSADFNEESAKAAIKTAEASATYSRMAASAARRSADLAEKAWLTADRPWISANVELAGPIKIPKERDRYITLPVKGYIANIGKSTASSIKFEVELFASNIKAAEKQGDVMRESAGPSGIGLVRGGRILFPEEKFHFEKLTKLNLGVFLDAIEERNREGWGGVGPVAHDNPVLMVTVTYGLPNDIEKRLRHTIVRWQVQRHGQKPNGFSGSPGETQIEWLELVQSFNGGSIS